MIDKEELKVIVRDALEDIFYSEDEYAPFNALQDKINKFISAEESQKKVEVSLAICDKFNDYMKNVDKLNSMINEFKGLVAVVRGEAKVVQKFNSTHKAKIRKLLEVLGE